MFKRILLLLSLYDGSGALTWKESEYQSRKYVTGKIVKNNYIVTVIYLMLD